jgi:hypothetical protein
MNTESPPINRALSMSGWTKLSRAARHAWQESPSAEAWFASSAVTNSAPDGRYESSFLAVKQPELQSM